MNVVLVNLEAKLLQSFEIQSLSVVQFLLDRMSLTVVVKLDNLWHEVMDYFSQETPVCKVTADVSLRS